MARIRVSSLTPTLSEVAVACDRGLPGSVLKGTTRAMVLEACQRRNVPIVEGRIRLAALSDVYFGLLAMSGQDRRSVPYSDTREAQYAALRGEHHGEVA